MSQDELVEFVLFQGHMVNWEVSIPQSIDHTGNFQNSSERANYRRLEVRPLQEIIMLLLTQKGT